jgi:HNH endonuclease
MVRWGVHRVTPQGSRLRGRGQSRLELPDMKKFTTSPEQYHVNEDGCWVWKRALQKDGYGIVHGALAHRRYYELLVGPIPDGLEIDHLCRNRACVNPDHMEPVTKNENRRRGLLAKLTKNQVREAKRLIADGVSHTVIGNKYGVTRACIYCIAIGRNWADIDVDGDEQ